MSKKFVEQEIAIIKDLATVKIPAVVSNHDMASFNTMKLELNTHILQALTGGEITKTKKGDRKIKFIHKLPTTSQVAEIAKICDNYAQAVESPLTRVPEDDEMSIPVQQVRKEIPTMSDKIKNKELQTYILDPTGVSTCTIVGTDCIIIASYGEAARKDANFKMALVIGGVTLVVAGCVAGGVVAYKKKHDKLDEVEIDSNSFEEIGIDEDEIPEVEIEEAAFSNMQSLGF